MQHGTQYGQVIRKNKGTGKSEETQTHTHRKTLSVNSWKPSNILQQKNCIAVHDFMY